MPDFGQKKAIMAVARVDPLKSALSANLESDHVLVVGADPGVVVVHISWQELVNQRLNIADYELVVLDLTSVPDDGVSRALAPITKDRVARLLQGPQHELVILGSISDSPGFFVQDHLPTALAVRDEQGSYLTEPDDEFSQYLELVRSYKWIVEVLDSSEHRIEWRPLVTAGRRDTVGLSLRWDGMARTIWLPAATAVHMGEGIRLLLSVTYGIGSPARTTPEWIRELSLPKADRVAKELEGVEGRLQPLLQSREELRVDIEASRRFLDSLFETGTRLEDLARDLLRELGAEVVDPRVKGKDDGSLTTPSGVRVVLEIKGRQGSIGLTDVRQLANWVDDRTYSDDDSEREDWRGLLVSNPNCDLPLNERGESYGRNAVDYARRKGLVLVTTEQLVEALRQIQEGNVKPTEWWHRLMESPGPFVWP